MEYIITWCIVTVMLVDCPHKPQKNEFGQVPNLHTTLAIACVEHSTDCNNHKEFEDKKEAYEFYERAKITGQITNVEIKEINLK